VPYLVKQRGRAQRIEIKGQMSDVDLPGLTSYMAATPHIERPHLSPLRYLPFFASGAGSGNPERDGQIQLLWVFSGGEKIWGSSRNSFFPKA